MSAFDEIAQRGDAGGPETLRLLRQLAAQVTRTSTFPPPDGHGHWSKDALDDLLADMFTKEHRGQVFVLACYAIATDQASLERLTLAAIRNHLVDQAKATERGKLRRRLGGLLTKDGRFLRPPEPKGIWAWALANRATGLWQGAIEELHAAAARVRGHWIRSWNTSGKTPQKTVDALTAVSYGVIDHANGSVLDEDLAKVVEHRFALIAPPVFVEIPDDALTSRGLHASAHGADPSSAFGLQKSAEQLWEALSPEEQSLLPVLAESLARRRTATGLGPAATQALTDSLAERLRLATVDDEDCREIILLMVDLASTSKASGRLSQVGAPTKPSRREESQ